MNRYLKRGLISLLVIIVYFTVWKEIRGFVTSLAIVPQIEYAITSCDDTIEYNRTPKSTSIFIYLPDREQNEYERYGYVAPAGFYLLFGLVFIVMAGGAKLTYYLLFGFHGIFWILSSILILPGLCIHPLFLHLAVIGSKYFTPFITFMILILLVSPDLRNKLGIESDKLLHL